jgi:hypothetical protein
MVQESAFNVEKGREVSGEKTTATANLLLFWIATLLVEAFLQSEF